MLTLAISSSVLFAQDWDGKGRLAGWTAHQMEHEQEPMKPGPAFAFARGLLALNDECQKREQGSPIQLHIVSQQSPDAIIRFLHSLEHHGLMRYYDHGLAQSHYLSGLSPIPVLRALQPHLYLSSDLRRVRAALEKGVAAAHLKKVQLGDVASLLPSSVLPLTIGTDGDAVFFDDEAERIFAQGGLVAFTEHERANALNPLQPGPLHGFLMALHGIRKLFPEETRLSPLRLAMVTARSGPAQERVIRTSRKWGARWDGFHSLAGGLKGPVLAQTGAVIFFDDGKSHIESATKHGVPAGHVPWGIRNLA